MPTELTKEFEIEVLSKDDSLGLVFGKAIVSTQAGEPYVDLQDDHIPADVMLKAATDFMLTSGNADDRHDGRAHGQIVHSFPLTDDIAKKFGIDADYEAWLIGMKPSADVFAKFQSGDRKGFSIGGVALEAA